MPDRIHKSSPISRRSFLKLGGLAFSSIFFLPGAGINAPHAGLRVNSKTLSAHLESAAEVMQQNKVFSLSGFAQSLAYDQGRVCEDYVDAFTTPDFNSKRTAVFWKDSVLPITSVAISEDTSSHNLVWYQVAGAGYVHSGSVQPVRTILNEVNKEIPVEGRLAEVTVPFTDARWSANKTDRVAYRIYFETTHWVTGLTQDESGDYWYSIIDDKYKHNYYIQAQHVRLVPGSELIQISSLIPNSLKRIRIFLEHQILVAYEQEHPVFFSRVATGGIFSTGTYTTPTGIFQTFHKRPSRHMAAGDLASNGYDLPGVPWISYITPSGIAIHGTYWHNNFGKPRSHGCINLSSQASKWIYRWTNPMVPYSEQVIYEFSGTLVEVVE